MIRLLIVIYKEVVTWFYYDTFVNCRILQRSSHVAFTMIRLLIVIYKEVVTWLLL